MNSINDLKEQRELLFIKQGLIQQERDIAKSDFLRYYERIKSDEENKQRAVAKLDLYIIFRAQLKEIEKKIKAINSELDSLEKGRKRK